MTVGSEYVESFNCLFYFDTHMDVLRHNVPFMTLNWKKLSMRVQGLVK